LHDAATYITGLPKKEADLAEWQAAIEALMLVVKQNGPTIFARIGVMRALNRHDRQESSMARGQGCKGRGARRRKVTESQQTSSA
jgi:hypothetical protein